MQRRWFVLWLPMVVWLAVTAPAAQAAAIAPNPILGRYEARTIVTGTDMRSRPSGFAACLTDVLVKVSGDPTLAQDARLPPIAANAAALVASYDYWDRMSGLPLHDEQGSSDRPFYLTVRFDPAKLDAVLRQLGRAPWTGPRPAIVPVIHVEAANGAFDLTAEEPHADSMRLALADTAQKYGIAVQVPPAGAAAAAGAVVVRGRLVFSQAALGWVGTWHLDWQGRGYDWGLSGVNFGEAFRQMVGGAVQIVSGHGAPAAAP